MRRSTHHGSWDGSLAAERRGPWHHHISSFRWHYAYLCMLLLCHAFLGSRAAAAHKPDYSIYMRKDDLLKAVTTVVENNKQEMQVTTVTAKDQDYTADIMVVTYEPGGLSADHQSKARLLLDFGEHGREFITSEVAVRMLQTLTDTAALKRLLGGSEQRLQRLQGIMRRVVMKIMPMENVNGRIKVEAGELCERKNGRGVDPNRNWALDWGVKEKDYDPKEEFPGRAPHSEPEVQIILNLAKALQPHVWLNVHSGMYALFTPYDHQPHTPNSTEARAALRMMQVINRMACKNNCVVGSGGKSVGYLAHGTGTDYMYEVLKVPLTFTWEIYGDLNAPYEDCFRMFNPLTKDLFEETVQLWVLAIVQLLELLPSHPSTQQLFPDTAPLTEAGDPLAYIRQHPTLEPLNKTNVWINPPSSSSSTPAAPGTDLGAQQQLVNAASTPSSSSEQQQQQVVKDLQAEAAELAIDGGLPKTPATGSSSGGSSKQAGTSSVQQQGAAAAAEPPGDDSDTSTNSTAPTSSSSDVSTVLGRKGGSPGDRSSSSSSSMAVSKAWLLGAALTCMGVLVLWYIQHGHQASPAYTKIARTYQ